MNIQKINASQSKSIQNELLVAIGGIGGSGTRLIIQIMEELGFYIGSDLNSAKDNLLFTLLFRRKNIFLDTEPIINHSFDILIDSLRGNVPKNPTDIEFLQSLAKGNRHDFSAAWLAERVEAAINQQRVKRRNLIAWKEPNTHVFLHRMLKYNSKIKYLHVVRDGLDMAFSKNQNQLRLWGDCYLNRPVVMSPADSLWYWNAVHLRILALKRQFPHQILMIRFEKICQRDEEELKRLHGFIGIESTAHNLESIDRLTKPPDSLGRAKLQDPDQFDSGALEQYYKIIKEIDS